MKRGDSIGLIKNPHKTEKHHTTAGKGSRNHEDILSISYLEEETC